jgi:TM2 domain-containing membrane protein YozV
MISKPSTSERKEKQMSAQGSTGNVIAAICSIFIPGLGQLVQGRLSAAIAYFLLAAIFYIVVIGLFIHIYSVYDAATFKPAH